jgi:ribulose-phosphate 3-epimerase
MSKAFGPFSEGGLLCPSIFAADFWDIRSAVEGFEEAGVPWIHYDVMDNHFVPNMSLSSKFIAEVSKRTKIRSDVHLMIDLDLPHALPPYLELPVEHVTVHLESPQSDLSKTFSAIRSADKTVGVSIKPGTGVSALAPWLDSVDLVLLMSVEPGFSGQKFQPVSISRLRDVCELVGNRNIRVQIDGGVGRDNAADVMRAGADFLVMGTAYFRDPDPKGLVSFVREMGR